MSDTKKTKYYKKDYSGQKAYNECVQALREKYYNLYRANFKWTGIDYHQERFIMNKFWKDGTVAAWHIANTDMLGFAPWAQVTINMLYGDPETVMLINNFGSPVIPTNPQVVDKDVCIGYIQRNQKPLAATCEWYIQRIAQVEMVIRTNLNTSKIPFLIPVESDDDKVHDLVDRILNNELVLFAEGADPSLFKCVATGAPYIIDKLQEYKTGLENELKTVLGENNSGAVEKREQLQLSEISANNDEINDHANNFMDSLTEWTDNIAKTLGITITVEATSKPVQVDGEVHDGDKPGPKEDSNDD